jgi:hypothetical protein
MQGDTAPLPNAQAEAEDATIPEETVAPIPLDVVDKPLVDTLGPSRHSLMDLWCRFRRGKVGAQREQIEAIVVSNGKQYCTKSSLSQRNIKINRKIA